MPSKTAASNAAAPRYIAFQAGKRLGEGTEAQVEALRAAQMVMDQAVQVLVFDLESGEQIELPQGPVPATAGAGNSSVMGKDATGVTPDVVATAPPALRPGRPKLGVVPREVTLLPHDWEWLNSQPGGASVTLRKLVLKARRLSQTADQLRMAQIVCYRFISAIAGNEAKYEEAVRALFTAKPEAFEACTAGWPIDVQTHARNLANKAFALPQPQNLTAKTEP